MSEERESLFASQAELDAVKRALQQVDATDPCPLCDSWPEHDAACVMATPELDRLIGRGWGTE